MPEADFDPFLVLFDFPVPNLLRTNDVTNLKDLLRASEQDLRGFDGFKNAHIETIKTTLNEHGLELGQPGRVRREPLYPDGIGVLIARAESETDWADLKLGIRTFRETIIGIDGSDEGRYLVTIQDDATTHRVQIDADEGRYECSCSPEVTNRTPPCPHAIAALLAISVRFRCRTMRRTSVKELTETARAARYNADKGRLTPVYYLNEARKGVYELNVLSEQPDAFGGKHYSDESMDLSQIEALHRFPEKDRLIISRLLSYNRSLDKGNAEPPYRVPDDLFERLTDEEVEALIRPIGGEPQSLKNGTDLSIGAELRCTDGQLQLRLFMHDAHEAYDIQPHQILSDDPAWVHSGSATVHAVDEAPGTVRLYRTLLEHSPGPFEVNEVMDELNESILPALREADVDLELGEGVLRGVDPVGELYLEEKRGELNVRLDFRSPEEGGPKQGQTYAVYQENGQVVLCEDSFEEIDLRVEAKKELRKRLKRTLKDVAGEDEGISALGRETFRVADPERWLGQKLPGLVSEGFDVYGRDDLSMFQTESELKEAEVEVSSDQDWFAMSGEFTFENEHGEQSTAALSALIEAIQNGEEYVKLADGSEGVISEKWKDRLEELMDTGASVDERSTDQVNVPKVAGNEAKKVLDEADETQQDEQAETFIEHWSELGPADETDPLPTPAGFEGQLRDYQTVGLGWLNKLTQAGIGGILADDMGLGKTIQVLSLLQHDRNQSGEWGRMLVVSPKSVIENWVNEADEFVPEAPACVHHGARRDDVEDLPDEGLIVTTYGTLRSDAEMLKKEEFDFAVLDEAHRIRNADTQSSQVVRSLQADQRFALTGTPVQNDITDLWAQFEFLVPGLLGSQAQFKRKFKSNSDDEQDNYDQLKQLIAPLILHRRKETVEKDLPGLTVKEIECQFSSEERRIYEKLRETFQIEMEAADPGDDLEILKKLMRLRQFCCSPKLIKNDPALDEIGETAEFRSSKVRYFEEAARRVIEAGHRILVFSQYTQFLDILQEVVREHDWGFQRYDGSTSNQEQVVDAFNSGDDPLFLISLKAGGEGLNLTAADHVFIMDPWWNPAAEEQAQDRAHRIGQTDHVYSYRFYCPDTVEQKVMALQDEKSHVADRLLTPDKNLLKSLDRDEIEGLF